MILVFNKKAQYEYQLAKKYRAGLVLTGAEVKSLRLKHASLAGAYVRKLGKELFLVNAQINAYAFANDPDYDPKKSRKLLLHKREVEELLSNSAVKGWSIIPLSIELVANRIKLNLALGKGKKEYEKRESVKKKDLKRELSRKNKMSQLKI